MDEQASKTASPMKKGIFAGRQSIPQLMNQWNHRISAKIPFCLFTHPCTQCKRLKLCHLCVLCDFCVVYLIFDSFQSILCWFWWNFFLYLLLLLWWCNKEMKKWHLSMFKVFFHIVCCFYAIFVRFFWTYITVNHLQRRHVLKNIHFTKDFSEYHRD